MNLLITGSSGFVGTNFINYSTDFKIYGVDLIKTSIDEIDFRNIDAVLHLAAVVHQMGGAPDELYFKINRDLAYEVARRAKNCGVKQFVFMSTAKVFGESTSSKGAWDENSVCTPMDAYGKSKYEAEKLIRGLDGENFKVAIVRSPLVYGVGVKANMYNLVKLVNNCPILPLAKIKNKRSFVFVKNLTSLLKHIIETQSSGIFIAGDTESLSTSKLVTLIAKALNKRVYLFCLPKFIVDFIKYFKPSIIDRLYGSLELDNSKTNKQLKYIPPYTTEEGIKEMVEWYLSKS